MNLYTMYNYCLVMASRKYTPNHHSPASIISQGGLAYVCLNLLIKNQDVLRGPGLGYVADLDVIFNGFLLSMTERRY